MPLYANYAGTSWPKPDVVLEASSAALAAPPSRWGELYDSAHARVAAAIGASTPDRLLFTSGCTAALATLMTSIELSAGDIVLTSGLEHHALARWPSHLAMTRGVEHAISPYKQGAPVDLGWVEEQLGTGRVRLIACAMASNVTGELLPVRELAQMARASGAMMLVDAAQTAGIMPLDVEDLGAHFVTFAGHKGPHGLQGTGALWASSDATVQVPAASCEIDAANQPPCGTFPSFCDVGSVNLPGIASLAAGFDWLATRPPTAEALISSRDALSDGLRRFGEVWAPRRGELGAPVASLSNDALDLSAIADALSARGIIARAGTHCAPLAHQTIGAHSGTLRFSLGPSNTPEDVEAILEALEELTAPGAR